MLDAVQQVHHTMTQQHDALLDMLYNDGTCVATPSDAVPTSCRQLTCMSHREPEWTLSCDIKEQVLPRLTNLIALLRQEVRTEHRYDELSDRTKLSLLRLHTVSYEIANEIATRKPSHC